ncbi:MAG TPA: SLATT domain-containing protein [Allosphingosinicella sp.]|nr:SLATT domain-containing protein [Allosphingosinicella sp.]
MTETDAQADANGAAEQQDAATSADPIKWFKPLPVKGDFTPATLDSYFEAVQLWIEDDMAFLRKPIARWRKRSYRTRGLAFAAVAAGVLLPLPIMNPWPGFPDGLRMGYLAVVLGGLVLLLDRVYNISNSWARLTLAEMQVKQVRYRLDLDWAKQRPLLTSDNGPTQGPILVDLLRAALDATHQIMETQKMAWTTELNQALDALRARLDSDRTALEQLRAQRQQDEQRPTTGAVNLTIDKPDLLKAPITVRVGDKSEQLQTVPARHSVNGVPAGLQTISLTAARAAGATTFAYSVTEQVTAGQAKTIAVAVV